METMTKEELLKRLWISGRDFERGYSFMISNEPVFTLSNIKIIGGRQCYTNSLVDEIVRRSDKVSWRDN